LYAPPCLRPLQARTRTADTPIVDAATQTNRRMLGELLVEEGFLDADQLAEALAEAQTRGVRLGTVLVERGILSGPALANVLADQQGGLVRTEYGIGTGFRATRTADETAEPPAEYVIVVARDGQSALHTGSGLIPVEGTHVTLGPYGDERFVVARHEWRRCLVVEPARP
jgi:hypothetical protein